MRKIIGRKSEIEILKKVTQTEKSEFIAIYGRRRVGKTFLVRASFEDKFTFQITAIANVSLNRQLANFYNVLQKHDLQNDYNQSNNWFDAFNDLGRFLEKSSDTKKVIFLDELPWFDSQNSNFIQALEHFWNSWASYRDDVILIVCGSAASWIINKLINNRGGLHNRITKKIKVVPFTLKECEQFLQEKNSYFDRYSLTQLYMCFGGIPYYWDEIKQEYSAMQNIQQVCFAKDGLLSNEFFNLYSSLFKNFEKHMLIIGALSQKNKGLTREEIILNTKLPNGGSLNRILTELEESGFIRKYLPFEKKNRRSLYQLVDFFSNFYIKFMKDVELEGFNWIAMTDHPQYRAWSGYAFEQVCMYHLNEIKRAMGIGGVLTSAYSWRSNKSDEHVQIDLLIDRRDNIINICEIKFSINPYEISKDYNAKLRNKIGVFKAETKTRKSVFLTMITTYGIKKNMHSLGLVQNEITMDALFE